MATSLPIPPELQRFVTEQIRSGRFANEQEFVVKIIELYREFQDKHDLLRTRVQRSVEQEERGESSPLDMSAIKDSLRAELDETGQPK